MKKRTTMTLDADNARRLARLQKERDLSWKDAVNTVIRRGLDEAERPFRPREGFKTRTLNLGELLFPSVKDALQALDEEHDQKKFRSP